MSRIPYALEKNLKQILTNLRLPNISLEATNGASVNLSLQRGTIVIYIYQKTSSPYEQGIANWDTILGAKGCTIQSCSFRDCHSDLHDLGCTVFGLSVQSTEYQKEVKSRLNLPFELLSDENFHFINKLSLPIFEIDDIVLAQRVTLVCQDGIIKKIFYPIEDPERNALDVLNYITRHLQ